MKFVFIISHDDNFAPTPKLVRDIMGWIRTQERRKVRLGGEPLKPAGEAITVRVRGGKKQITAGPFAKSREKMCAYELVEVADLDAAVALAATHPMAAAATLEVRPVWADLA